MKINSFGISFDYKKQFTKQKKKKNHNSISSIFKTKRKIKEHNFNPIKEQDSVLPLVEDSYEEESPTKPYFQLKKNLEDIDESQKSINNLLRQRKKNTFGKIEKLDKKIQIYFKRTEDTIEENENYIKDLHIIFKIQNKQKRQTLLKNIQKYFSSLLLKKILTLKKSEERFFKIKEDLSFQNLNNSNFDFINQNQILENQTILYDQNGNLLKMNEIVDFELTDEMKQIYKGISHLTKLIKNMVEIVAGQGQLVDRIDCNMGLAVEMARKTNESLVVTKEVMQGSLAGRCLGLLLGFNLVVFLLVLIKFFY